MPDDRLYFRQLLSGRDFGSADRMAQQMVNFVYLIGDRHTGDAVIVDPANDVAALLQVQALAPQQAVVEVLDGGANAIHHLQDVGADLYQSGTDGVGAVVGPAGRLWSGGD